MSTPYGAAWNGAAWNRAPWNSPPILVAAGVGAPFYATMRPVSRAYAPLPAGDWQIVEGTAELDGPTGIYPDPARATWIVVGTCPDPARATWVVVGTCPDPARASWTLYAG